MDVAQEVEAGRLAVHDRDVAGDDPVRSRRRTRAWVAGGERPMRRARSSLERRPSSWSSRRMASSISSRAGCTTAAAPVGAIFGRGSHYRRSFTSGGDPCAESSSAPGVAAGSAGTAWSRRPALQSPTGAAALRSPLRGPRPGPRLHSPRSPVGQPVSPTPGGMRAPARPRIGPVAQGRARPPRAPGPIAARRPVDRRRRDGGGDDRGRERAAGAQPRQRLRGHEALVGQPVHDRPVRPGARGRGAPHAGRRRGRGPPERHGTHGQARRRDRRARPHRAPRLRGPGDGPRQPGVRHLAAQARRDRVRALQPDGRGPARKAARSPSSWGRTRPGRWSPAASRTSPAGRRRTSSAS